MKLATVSVLIAAVAIGVGGIAPERQVLVTYPKDTPESTLDSAKDAIRAAVSYAHDPYEYVLILSMKGGQITAEFSEFAPPIEMLSRMLIIAYDRSHQVLLPHSAKP